MRFLLILISLLIIYGSLFPFEFDGAGISHDALLTFLTSWNAPTSRGDLLGNIALFIPFGFVGMLVFSRSRSLVSALALLTGLAIVLSVGSQVAQIAVPARVPALVDAIWNMFGTLIGVAVAWPERVQKYFDRQSPRNLGSVPLLLIGLWFSSRLIPFVPTIDWQSYKEALKPLILAPEFRGSGAWFQTGAWLACAHFGTALMGRHWRDIYMPVAIALILVGQIVMVGHSLSLTNVVAAVAAMLGWVFFLRVRSGQTRAGILAAILVAAFVIDGFAPYSFGSQSSAFIWIPFGGFLTGSMILNAMVLSEKLFVFGAILHLLKDARWSPVSATMMFAGLALTVEVAQNWLAGRTPEITDPLLILAMGLAWMKTADSAGRGAPVEVLVAEDKPAPGPKFAEAFAIRLDVDQYEFLRGVANAIDTDFDHAVGSLIDELQSRFGHGTALQQALLDRMHAGSSQARLGKSMTGHSLQLSMEHGAYIKTLSTDTGASPSRVIRLLVDIFIADCQGD